MTSEGLEANLAVNYLGNFLLTTQLLPKLKESPDARVLCVNSSLHKTVRGLRHGVGMAKALCREIVLSAGFFG